MPRLPTVYDFASLRLHPDGSQVQQSASQNQKSRYAARVVQDSRGNWFARDAAGTGVVGRYRKEKQVKNVKQECEEQWNDICEEEPSKSRGKGEEGTTGQKPAKRQKFFEDYGFLTPTASEGSDRTHALPSSDLLKSIHYFASSYYHERGQLFNASKEYRQKRKQNRLTRLQKKAKPDGEGAEELEEDSDQDEAKPPRRGGRTKGVGRIIYRKDMYKILDGSALMAIGMLIQEYVSRTLEVRIPDGWEDMIQDAYSDEEVMAEDGDPDAEITDANSEDDAENDCESQEDESRGDDDNESDEDGGSKVQQDNSQRDEEEEEAGD